MRRFLILLLIAAALFVYGAFSRVAGLPPHFLLAPAFNTLDQQLTLADMDPREGAVRPAQHKEPGARRTQAGTPQDGGVVLITSHWPDSGEMCGVRVIDREGNVLHTWKTDPVELWGDMGLQLERHQELVRSDNGIHGIWLFPNGDVLFNIEYVGLTRMNAKGEVVWQLSEYTHHSVTRDEDGNFWVCGAWQYEDPQEAMKVFPGRPLPIHEDRCLKVSPDGKVLKEVSTSSIVLHHPELRRVVRKTALLASADILHQNDVDPLPSDLADQYPGFEAGDLLISLRDIDTVLVIDPDTEEVKWWTDRYTNKQHDPDWIGDGWISVFDNNVDSAQGRVLGGTRLLAIHIPTGASKVLIPPADALFSPPSRKIPRRFFTAIGGKAQRLPNGNWMLTEVTRGRALEVDPKGRTTWEWVQQPVREGKKVFEVMEASWYPYDPETVRAWGKH